MKTHFFIILFAILFVSCERSVSTQETSEFLSTPFVHPGMAQNQEDLDYMKQQVLAGEEPWKTAFENLKAKASLEFQPEPFTHISVGPYGANSIGGSEFSQSAAMAYNHAIMWYITGNQAHADKAIEIINAWSYRLWDFDANNAKLNVGLSGPEFLNAAEILKYTDSGWEKKDEEQFTRMVMTVFYPTIRDFFTEANGNWDASIINTLLAIGVWMDNHDIFNTAIERYYRGIGNSGITKYIYPTGQCQEATRDWDHVQLGLGEFAKAAQTAWTQGLDLYSVADHRLALGYEYMSKFLLGGEVPFWGVISYRDTAVIKDVYESIYAHYQSRNTEMPYTHNRIHKYARPRASISLLTGIKAPRENSESPITIAVSPLAASPDITGALAHPTATAPANAIVIRPGQSIQQAIDANAGTNKWIVLTKGVHTLSEPIKMKSGIVLAGQGRSTILHLSPTSSTMTIINATNDLHDVTIRDLLIEGASNTVANLDPNHDRRNRSYMNAPSRGGILFSADERGQMKNIHLENVTVQNCTKNGVSIRGASNVKVIACDFSDNGGNVVPGAGFHHNLHLVHVDDVVIKNGRFDTSPWGSGIDMFFVNNVIVSNNEMARNRLSGIRLVESKDISITENLVEGNDKHGLHLETLMDGSKNVNVTKNLLQNNGID
jgi:parallel beta-helix repeat protein